LWVAPRAAAEPVVVKEITQLYPVTARGVIAPTTLEELVRAVKETPGPLSIGGGRYSMGGQTATEQAVQIDMRQFNQVAAFSAERKEITVQAGITWRKIQEYIDPYNLSLQIMQTYANFTVGGALSVNAHGRYIGMGPLVLSVKSIRVVLADGTVVNASPTERSEVFYGAIGGYGSLGVIAEATLQLTDNVHVERHSEVMPLSRYWQFFDTTVRHNPAVVFHNADIYPNAYDTVRVTSYLKTDKPVTVKEHLWPTDTSFWVDRQTFRIISEWPGGKWIRQHIVDPIVFRGQCVEWRNYEASYDVRELEPSSRRESTYVLQEYFVPVEHMEVFVSRMGDILNRHHVNVINISIRHAKPDPGTLLAWARKEVFAYVLYYKQGTAAADRLKVGEWTRELIDAAVALDGAYYLPYQIHATKAQFHAAYPNAERLFELKRTLDPTYKFRNKLWDAYYEPTPVAAIESPAPPLLTLAQVQAMKGYKRDEAQTYLTLPEWVLVYNPAEYAQYLSQHEPSGYPYFHSIGQFWGTYRHIYGVTRQQYPFNFGYHFMVMVIGTSYTVEYGVKGLYEKSVGRVTEWLAGGVPTAEDQFAAAMAQRYVDFIRVRPWYEYSFLRELKGLWRQPWWGPHPIRKWERRLILSAEYLVKAPYAGLITVGTKAAYGTADKEILVVADNLPPSVVALDDRVRLAGRLNDGGALLGIPRYEAFRDAAAHLAQGGVHFRELAGNGNILMTSVVPASWNYTLPAGKVILSEPILTNPQTRRIGVIVPVPSLDAVLRDFSDHGMSVEHLYDY
jgi:FAD/FMN-containing dehydrogenase